MPEPAPEPAPALVFGTAVLDPGVLDEDEGWSGCGILKAGIDEPRPCAVDNDVGVVEGVSR